MKVINKKTSDLIPYANNPRKNDAAVDKVAASIKEFGFKVPIVIDKDNVIVTGHTRLKAANKLGMEDVPCVIADDLTKAQIKAFRIADNRVSEEAEWDMDMLSVELECIGELDFDIDVLGFDEKELNGILEQDEVVEDEFDEEPPENPISKRGDIWLLGRHRVMCGDSTSDDVDVLMDGNKADMVFTDPPYNVSFNGRSGKYKVIKNDSLEEDEFEKFITDTTNKIKELNPKSYYVWCNWKFYGILQNKLKFKSCIVWAKNVFGMGNGYRHQHEFCLFNGDVDNFIKNESDLWEVKKDTNYVHPTQKPIELSVRAFSNHATQLNVVDLFGGSGSTLIGAEQTGRNCYMMELDEKYVDVIVNRYIAFKESSDDVKLLRDGKEYTYEEAQSV